MEISSIESKLLALAPAGLPLGEAASRVHEHIDSVRRAVEHLRELGWLSAERSESSELYYSEEGQRASHEGLPEIRLLQTLASGPVSLSSLPPELSRVGVGIARRNNWVQMSSGQVSITDMGRAALEQRASHSMPSTPADLPPSRAAELAKRGLLREQKTVRLLLSITDAGREVAASAPGGASLAPPVAGMSTASTSRSPSSASIGALDRNLLITGGWKTKSLRRYDVSTPTETSRPARRHPISRLRERIRLIFLSMGFEEMEGPLAESAFWNFDALFQPQDHPARDLADTFYLPGPAPLPSRSLVNSVREQHEKGWKYSWQEGPAKGQVLRTHTTAVSARTLHEAANDSRPRKFFSVGKVFRNEATDYKHLAEFFQVEGIIVHPGATLGHLLGTLKSFYAKLGFEKIRFRPSYFPYTEPSLEVEVYHPKRETWLELGGAGVFRPEVCGPLVGQDAYGDWLKGSPASRYPVLAWGLSLERPLMLASQTEDIRTLYRNDLGWLRNFPVE